MGNSAASRVATSKPHVKEDPPVAAFDQPKKKKRVKKLK